MKVYYIGMGYQSCYYVRCLQPLIHNGYNGESTSLRTKRVDNKTLFEQAIKSDVIVFHRPMDLNQLKAAILLKQLGKIIIMDNDDTYIKDSGVPTKMFGKLNKKLKKAVEKIDDILKKFASISDLVTVSTDFLKEEYKEYNNNVITLKNCVDPLDWSKPKRNEEDTIRIGIVGSVASNKDYQQIKPLLDKLKENPKVVICLFALPEKKKGNEWAVDIYKPEYEFWNQYNVEWKPFCQIEDYMDTLNNLRLDLMLIPRYDSYFNRAKSNIKFLEASMCEVPVVAQGFADGLSPYQGEEDSKHMEIAFTEQDWIDKTMSLIDNKDKRIQMGKKAREYVINNYNIANNAHKWADAYSKIWNEKKQS